MPRLAEATVGDSRPYQALGAVRRVDHAPDVGMPTLVHLITLGGARLDVAERQARVLWLHHCATPQQTYTAIAKALGVCTARARQLEDAALHRVRVGLQRSPYRHPTIPEAWK
jgi:hypothetical protein